MHAHPCYIPSIIYKQETMLLYIIFQKYIVVSIGKLIIII